MVNTLRQITNLFKGIEEDFRELGIFGWILFPILLLIVLLIFILSGVIALIILLDMFFNFIIKTYIKKKK